VAPAGSNPSLGVKIVAKRGFLVTFTSVGSADSGIHRIRNWAEDLYREVMQRVWGTVEPLDTATDRVWVTASSARVMGDLGLAVRRSLKKHHLFADAVVTKLTTSAESTVDEPKHAARR
jgi:hypothetical protein